MINDCKVLVFNQMQHFLDNTPLKLNLDNRNSKYSM